MNEPTLDQLLAEAKADQEADISYYCGQLGGKIEHLSTIYAVVT